MNKAGFRTGSGTSGLSVPTFGLLANRPAAPTAVGQSYFATDDAGGTWYLNNGGAWQEVGKRGQLGIAQVTAVQTITSTVFVAVTGLTTTVTVGARPVRITFGGNVRLSSVVAGNACTIVIMRDGAPGVGTQVDQMTLGERVAEAGNGGWTNATFWGEDNPSAASHTYALYAETPAAGGSIVFNGAAGLPLKLMVEEV